MITGMLLLCAAASLTAGMLFGSRRDKVWLALTLAGTSAILAASSVILVGGGTWEWRGGFFVGGEAPHFFLDGLSALFLAGVGVVGGAGAIYSREYWPDKGRDPSAGRGRVAWCALVLSMMLVLVCANGLHFLIAWELFAVSAYFLITMDRRQREARAAGWLYLAASHAGTMCLFAFFGMLAARTGSWELGPMHEQENLRPLFWLALAGFGVKAGLFPLHIWLPSAHGSAPSHVSAIMSGVAIKMGIYGMVRFSGWLPAPAVAGQVVVGLGAMTALFGIVFALAQNDLKRLLAYCSVENIGIIVTGVGTAMLGAAHHNAAWGRVALAGALLHVWNHGAFKSLLFFGAGSVLHGTGTREMSRLGGLWRSMPWTTGLFALGSLAVAGLPPLNGFVSEWLVFLGLLEAVADRSAPGPVIMLSAILLAMAGAVALACFAKATAVTFLGAPRTREAEEAHECGSLMVGPSVALGALCLGIGFAPMLFWPMISQAVGAWNPTWVGSEPPAPLLAIGAAQAVLALGACAGGGWLWWKVRANGVRRAATWGCGYAAPAARMQYTSGSFSGIVSGWFGWLLRPERKLRRPRGPLPTTAIRVARVPETVLEHVLMPAGALVLRLSSAARRLQHGRLQAYIAYVLAALVAVTALVLMEAGQ